MPLCHEAAVAILVARIPQIDAWLDNILLQRQVSNGIEALVGVTADPLFS